MTLNNTREFTEVEKKLNEDQNLVGYEKEKFNSMKSVFKRFTDVMDRIEEVLKEGDKLGIGFTNLEHKFDFAEFYNSYMKSIEKSKPINIQDLYKKLSDYNFEIQTVLNQAKGSKAKELKEALQ